MWCLLVQTEIMRRAFIFIPSRPIYKHTSSNEVCLRRLRSPNKESSNGAASCMLSFLQSIQVSIRDPDSLLFAGWRAAASGKSNSADAKLSCGLRAPRARWHVAAEAFHHPLLLMYAQNSSMTRHPPYLGPARHTFAIAKQWLWLWRKHI